MAYQSKLLGDARVEVIALAQTSASLFADDYDEVTVKRLRRRGNSVQLLPENPDFEPIEVDQRSEEFSIEGVAVGVIRNGRSF